MKLFLLLITMSVGLAAQPHPSVSLSWVAGVGGDPVTGFHVQRGMISGGPYTIVGTVPAGTLTYLDVNVTAGSTYYYVVTAYNAGGESSKSNEVTCTLPVQAPQAPTSLSGTVK